MAAAHGGVAAIVTLGLAGAGPPPAAAAPPVLPFHVLARVGRHMDSVLWTGSRFLYVENTANTVWSAPAAGAPIAAFASMPRVVEETRCILSPGAHGFPAGVVFCHSPDNKIYEISADGSSVSLFATLPAPAGTTADGALTFDGGGAFGYRLLAATGRSGARRPSGGVVYAIDASGSVQEIGGYHGPGGADEVVIAPPGFGAVAGDALVSVDAGAGGGSVVAIAPDGRTETVARFADGVNPIVPIPSSPGGSGGQPAPGIYMTDDESPYVFFAPAAALAAEAGDVLVGTENTARFWIIEPAAGGYRAVPVPTTLQFRHTSLEQAVYVG